MAEKTEKRLGQEQDAQHSESGAESARHAASGTGLPYPLLREVSRSFYLTLRVLPASIRPQIALAYLLARTTDTIADTELVPVENRLTALEALRQRILGSRQQALDLGALAPQQASAAERQLLNRCEEPLAILARLSGEDQQLVREVLDTITSGQELDLRRFGHATAQRPAACQTEHELDDYTYRVAGCVGEFWTRMCRLHVFPHADLDDVRLLALGVRFGKGLQLVNILRDLPEDLRRGRSYLPLENLKVLGLAPKDLLDPQNEDRARPLFEAYLEVAVGHLRAGWAYTLMLPRGCVRVRLACAWPVLIGLETLERLKAASFLNPHSKTKVSRRRVKQIMLRSILLLPWESRWRRMASGNG